MLYLALSVTLASFIKQDSNYVRYEYWEFLNPLLTVNIYFFTKKDQKNQEECLENLKQFQEEM